jgi:hypothetical protein
VVNVFVGGMVGLERATTSLIGARVFHLSDRFWRDLGYAIWAVVAGLLTQALGLSAAVIAGGAITLASGLLAARWITGGSPPPVAAQAQAQAQAQLGEAQPARARQASRR